MKMRLLRNVLLITMVVVAGYYIFFHSRPTREDTSIDIRQFTGGLVSVEGNVVTVEGSFTGPLGTIPEHLLLDTRLFLFQVDDSTDFNKEEVILPAWEELAATGETSGTFYFKDLPQTESQGSLADLNNSLTLGGVHAEVDFPSSIHDTENPTASSVFYQVLVQEPPLEQI